MFRSGGSISPWNSEGLKIWSFGFRSNEQYMREFQVLGLAFRGESFGFMVYKSWFMVWGVGIRGVGLEVWE